MTPTSFKDFAGNTLFVGDRIEFTHEGKTETAVIWQMEEDAPNVTVGLRWLPLYTLKDLKKVGRAY